MNEDVQDEADEYWAAMRSAGAWNEHVRVHAADFIGLSEVDGRMLAATLNWDVRVISMTEDVWYTSEYKPGRVNLSIRDGRVESISAG